MNGMSKDKTVQSDKSKKPTVYINNFTTEIKEGTMINCRKIKNMGVVMYLNERLNTYDVFKIELHRFGNDENIIAASKNFIPGSAEFKKKYVGKDSLKLNLLSPEGNFSGSDFEVNTLIFPSNSVVNDVICTYHDKKHCNFYLVVKGYNKTGEKNNFGEDLFNEGIEISARSNVFKNWENKTN